jgi:hypothetical protein
MQQALLDFFQAGGDLVQDGEETVHDGIEEAVQKKARVVVPQAGAGVADTLAHLLDGLAGALLEAQECIAAEEETDLLRVRDGVPKPHPPGHHEEPAGEIADRPVILGLGAVGLVQRVLEGERMDLVFVRQQSNDGAVL